MVMIDAVFMIFQLLMTNVTVSLDSMNCEDIILTNKIYIHFPQILLHSTDSGLILDSSFG